MVFLRVERVSVGYGETKVVSDVSFSARSGELLLVSGPNGAGKTTLLKAVAGLVRHEGRVLVDGVDVSTLPAHRRVEKGVLYCSSERRVFPKLSVRQNLLVANVDPKEAVRVFPRLNDLLDIKAGRISGGEQQMVNLARAFLSKPRILLLDEPLMNLHRDVAKRVLLLVERVLEGGSVVIVADPDASPWGSIKGFIGLVELAR